MVNIRPVRAIPPPEPAVGGVVEIKQMEFEIERLDRDGCLTTEKAEFFRVFEGDARDQIHLTRRTENAPVLRRECDLDIYARFGVQVVLVFPHIGLGLKHDAGEEIDFRLGFKLDLRLSDLDHLAAVMPQIECEVLRERDRYLDLAGQL